MKVFGLTGGIGMGKTAAEQILRERGVPVVDTDLLARQIVQPGQPALKEIQSAFGNEIVGSDGQLRRDELAKIVFSDSTARQKLEGITHPRIGELWLAQIETWRNEGRRMAVVVIPLLFETNAETEFDAVICVACTAATQRQRLVSRGWTLEEIEQRIAAQWPIEQKITRAHHIIWTEAGMDVHAGQLDRIFPKG